MSVIGTYRTVFGDESGTDGRALTDIDLNAISINMSRRAWEVPGYAKLLGHDEISSSGVINYSTVFAASGSRLLKYGVFTIGRGLEVSSAALVTSVGAGFLGIWNDPTGPAPPPASGANRMHWVSVGDGDITATHTLAATGKVRWDLVCVTTSEVNAPTVARHFQDATTGARTSQSVVPARYPTIAVSVVSGDEDVLASVDMPFITGLDAGTHVAYAVLVSDSAIVSVWDFTVPVGAVKDSVTMGCEGVPYGSEIVSPAWTVAQNQSAMKSVTSAAGDLLIFPPAHVRGAPDRLLLGVKITHKLYSGNTVKLVSFPTGTTGTVDDVVDLSASITKDGTPRVKMLDLRGVPASENMQPLWLNGTGKKGAVDSALCLRINAESPTNAAYIYSVRWFYL